MIITTERVLLAVVALGFFFYLQNKGRRRSEEYLKRVQNKQKNAYEEDSSTDTQEDETEEFPESVQEVRSEDEQAHELKTDQANQKLSEKKVNDSE